jgi:hypothetical protein
MERWMNRFYSTERKESNTIHIVKVPMYVCTGYNAGFWSSLFWHFHQVVCAVLWVVQRGRAEWRGVLEPRFVTRSLLDRKFIGSLVQSNAPPSAAFATRVISYRWRFNIFTTAIISTIGPHSLWGRRPLISCSEGIRQKYYIKTLRPPCRLRH